MYPVTMSDSTLSEDAATHSPGLGILELDCFNPLVSSLHTELQTQLPKIKKKRSLPGNPDPESEVVALSPKTLLATNRYVCEICNKGFQRDQNLQLHRRGHNLPWKLKQKNNKDNRKKVYVCPEPTCVHHHPSRALGDLTGIKKHFCRKHGEKKWKCDKCSKIYAVQSDWKAHSKICGTREYRCDCGTLFSRKDSFVTHRAFCDALAEESARLSVSSFESANNNTIPLSTLVSPNTTLYPPPFHLHNQTTSLFPLKMETPYHLLPPHHLCHEGFAPPATPHLSATALLQRAAAVGATPISGQSTGHFGTASNMVFGISPEYMDLGQWQKNEGMTRDFLGLRGECSGEGGGCVGVRDLMSYAEGFQCPTFQEASGSWGGC